jgi:hypothetical protein
MELRLDSCNADCIVGHCCDPPGREWREGPVTKGPDTLRLAPISRIGKSSANLKSSSAPYEIRIAADWGRCKGAATLSASLIGSRWRPSVVMQKMDLRIFFRITMIQHHHPHRPPSSGLLTFPRNVRLDADGLFDVALGLDS